MGLGDIFKSASDAVLKTLDDGHTLFKKFKNQKFMDANMAACAMTTAADGKIESSEVQQTLILIGRDEDLSCFDPPKMTASFQDYIKQLKEDEVMGKMNCLAAISAITDPKQRVLIVGKCVSIAKIDGDYDESEKTVVKEICGMYDLDPAPFIV